MYALQNYIGEEKVNLALGRVIEKFGYTNERKVLATDVINEFKNVTPDTMEYLITDLFETITLHENKALEADCKKLENGK